MEIRNILTFLKVAGTQNFSKAAEQLGYSQSAVTIQIQQLEKELGTQLFERIGKRVYLTEKGQEFIGYASEIMRVTNEALTFAGEEHTTRGTLKIGGVESTCTALLTIIISYYLIHNGYKLGKKSIVSLLHGGKMKNIIFTANVIGLTMMGALSASYVTLSTPLEFSFSGGSTIVLQDVLNLIAPGLLPLAAVFIIYTYLKKKGPHYTKILLTVVVVSIIASLLGIL